MFKLSAFTFLFICYLAVDSKYQVDLYHYMNLGNCPHTPPPKPTLTLTSYLGQHVGFREGWVGSFPETYNDR